MKRWSIILGLMIVFLLSMSMVAFAGTSTPADWGLWDTEDAVDNANKTGQNPISKQRGGETVDGHRSGIHGNYTTNTNACASCHQTHTASAKNLLFADEEFKVCIACHDGTAGGGNRNVMREPTQKSHVRPAGTFAGTHEGNMSAHNVSGMMTLSAAPGANLSSDGEWSETFTCTSCHAPHGSYSNSYIHYNVNNTGKISTEDGGLRLQMVDVVSFENRASASFPAVVKGTKEQHGIEDARIKADDIVIAVYTAANTRSTQAWLYGYSRGSQGRSHGYDTQFFKQDYDASLIRGDRQVVPALRPFVVDQSVSGVGYSLADGYMYGPASLMGDIVKADIARAVEVRFVDAPWSTPGAGVAYSEFCMSCHTDYMASSGSATGSEDNPKYYRHSTNSDRFTCALCHYAHGTDVTVMHDALGRTIWDLMDEGYSREAAETHMRDVNPSSALKKYTNMTSCWACHNSSKATSLKNTDSVRGERPSGMTNPGQYESPYVIVATGIVQNNAWDSASVRPEPNGSAQTIGSIRNGDTVQIIGESGSFYQILYNNGPDGFGYIYRTMVTDKQSR